MHPEKADPWAAPVGKPAAVPEAVEAPEKKLVKIDTFIGTLKFDPISRAIKQFINTKLRMVSGSIVVVRSKIVGLQARGRRGC